MTAACQAIDAPTVDPLAAEEESWDEDDDDDWDDMPLPAERSRANQGAAKRPGGYDAAVARQAQMQRLQARVNFDVLPQKCSGMSKNAENSIINSEAKANTAKNLGLTRDTRATVEGVLDPRTLLVLGKFLKRGLFDQIHGCISTGKEANVYYATAGGDVERAIKVYKTSILVFKDRARYIEGEYRFRNGCSKGNPRKMVAQWAEKEMRNLRRLRASGIMCPEVIEVRQNVLVMEFVGENGDAAPRLKDAGDVSREEWSNLYYQMVIAMRRMMQDGRLVHGDLSEYNILYLKGKLWIIDVSQSVECDHPHALDFLKRDCVNVNGFFSRKMDSAALPVKRLFDFVVSKILKDDEGKPFESDELALDDLLESAEDCPDEADDAVFVQTWIPSNLDQIADNNVERDIEKRKAGQELNYDRLLAPVGDGEDEEDDEDAEEEDAEADNAEADVEGNVDKDKSGAASDGGDDAKAAESGSDDEEALPDGRKPEGMSKAEWKAKVKEEKRQKRVDKIPKHIKKRYRAHAAQGR